MPMPMPRLVRFAPTLFGLALAAPASALAQAPGHPHADSGCAYCAANHAPSLTPVVREGRGPFGLPGSRRVVIPAGHLPEGAVPAAPGMASSFGVPTAAPGWEGGDPTAGVAAIGPGYDPVPATPYGVPFNAGEPMPIGEMRTSYDPNMPGPSAFGPSAAPMMGAPAAAAPMAPNPAIEAWHQMGLGDESAPRRHGAMSRMLGVASVSNWLQEKRTLRVMRQSQHRGMYAPTMNHYPGQALGGR